MPTVHDRSKTGLPLALTDTLLEISSDALTAGVYEMAYHALAGALHGAESAVDQTRLTAIQAESLRQQDVVDAQVPGHRLSRAAGRAAGHSGWFEVLAVQAGAIIVRLRAADALGVSGAQRRANAAASETAE